MRILVLLSMIVAIGILSGCGGRKNFTYEITAIRGNCPDEAVRAAILDSRWQNVGQTIREALEDYDKYVSGEYESREEYLVNLGREGHIRSLGRIVRTFVRNIDETVPSCRSEVQLDELSVSSDLLYDREWFLLERRNGRTLACLSRGCSACGISKKVEYEPESYDVCVDRKGEVQ